MKHNHVRSWGALAGVVATGIVIARFAFGPPSDPSANDYTHSQTVAAETAIDGYLQNQPLLGGQILQRRGFCHRTFPERHDVPGHLHHGPERDDVCCTGLQNSTRYYFRVRAY